MKNNMLYNLTLKFVGVIFILGALYSCVPVRDQVYIQDKEKSIKKQEAKVYEVKKAESTVIKLEDELYITILSPNEDENIFSQGSGASTNPYLSSYTVNDSGNIRLPFINNVMVEGLTIKEASELIESKLAEYMYLPNVSIKLVNTKVYVLGEVNSPGAYTYEGANLNVLQALTYAGDITTYGNRKKVLLIRDTGEEVIKEYYDLTDDQSVLVEHFRVESGDVIYVEPLKNKKYRFNDNFIPVMISLVNLTVVFYTLVFVSNN